MQGELKTMREFRRKRAELQDQLDHMSQSLEDTQHDHKQHLTILEHKFFEEKVKCVFCHSIIDLGYFAD